MPVSRDQLMSFLADLGIASMTTEHEPLFTVEESQSLRGRIAGRHSKNLFLTDKKGAYFLVVAEEDSVIDLKRLHERIGASGRLSFGSAERLAERLGVLPGSVTPLALINDQPATVQIILDAVLHDADAVNFHPLINTATTTITPADLVKFLRATGHEPLVLEFSTANRVG